MRWLVLIVVSILLVSGCVSENQTTKTINESNYCETDDDCVIVNDNCCGCGAGGGRLAIARSYLENWSEKLGDCSAIGCPPIMSTGISCFSEPLCINNTCTLVPTKDVIASEIRKCERISDKLEKPRCYIDFALKRKNPYFCDELSDKFKKEKTLCYLSVALEKKGYRICDSIGNEDEKASCYLDVAINTSNPSICDGIAEGHNLKYQCYIHFSGVEYLDTVTQTAIDKIFYCADDLDCTMVRSDCCGCDSGGENIAMAGGFRGTWEQALEKKCKDNTCPDVISEHPTCLARPICLTNRCILTPAMI